MIVRTISRAAFECRDRSCAPPPVGTGGSRPSGGGGGGGTQRTAEMEETARQRLRDSGFKDDDIDEVLSGGGSDSVKRDFRSELSRMGFTKGQINSLVSRDSEPTPKQREDVDQFLDAIEEQGRQNSLRDSKTFKFRRAVDKHVKTARRSKSKQIVTESIEEIEVLYRKYLEYGFVDYHLGAETARVYEMTRQGLVNLSNQLRGLR